MVIAYTNFLGLTNTVNTNIRIDIRKYKYEYLSHNGACMLRKKADCFLLTVVRMAFQASLLI